MWTDLSQEDYAVVEGIRQALVGNRVTREEVIALADQGVISPKQFFYLGDVWGKQMAKRESQKSLDSWTKEEWGTKSGRIPSR